MNVGSSIDFLMGCVSGLSARCAALEARLDKLEGQVPVAQRTERPGPNGDAAGSSPAGDASKPMRFVEDIRAAFDESLRSQGVDLKGATSRQIDVALLALFEKAKAQFRDMGLRAERLADAAEQHMRFLSMHKGKLGDIELEDAIAEFRGR